MFVSDWTNEKIRTLAIIIADVSIVVDLYLYFSFEWIIYFMIASFFVLNK